MTPLRIDPTVSSFDETNKNKKGEKAEKSRKTKARSFGDVVEKTREEKSQFDFDQQEHRDLNDLIEELEKIGDKLVRFCSKAVLDEYKEIVKMFMKKTIGEAYEVVIDSKLRLNGRQIYMTVHGVEKRLQELTDAVLGREAERTKIASIVEEIKGLLLDLRR